MPDRVANDWPTLALLQGTPEPERRRILRFHPETVSQPQDRELRLKLDVELGKLGRLELVAEASTGSSQKHALKEIAAVSAEFEELIYGSPAFAHYVDSYLYFKVRFAVGRWRNSCGPEPAAASARGRRQDRPEWNERPIGLPTPPPVDGGNTLDSRADMERFLALPRSPAEEEALNFLDGFVRSPDEPSKFELWLRGLYIPSEGEVRRFETLARGLYEWTSQRSKFYIELEERRHPKDVGKWLFQPRRVEGTWYARNPLSARCGVTDLYWLAKVLRADVSPRGVVTYVHRSWLYYLPSLSTFPKEHLPRIKEQILRIEDVLRATFDFACELIQNAVEMAEYCETASAYPRDYKTRPSGSDDWRPVQDNEIDEISAQRKERLVPGSARPRSQSPPRGDSGSYWSERIRTGEYEQNLVGIALSGGGIRSATFALGVLQRLKDLDLLRHVDYLSTVSGGGYIGAWLLGNVRRSHYFLSRMTSWDESIAHLRRYSKYLAPQSGLLSADSWVMWGTWIRNALLIQLTTVAWLWTSFAVALSLKAVFEWLGSDGINSLMHKLLTFGFIVLALAIAYNLLRPSDRSPTQHKAVVVLAWFGSFLSAALLWAQPHYRDDYSHLLATQWTTWPPYLGLGLVVTMLVLTFVSFRDTSWHVTILGSLGVAPVSAGVIYLALCGVRFLFGVWASLGREQFGWYAYVFGPTLVMLAVTLSVVVFIGLVGSASKDWRREWWTRYGSWLAIYGAAFLALALVAVFGHIWLVKLFERHQAIKWSAVGGWLASVVAGLLSGNSSKTKGNGEDNSKTLELIARLGGLLFIVGAVVALSSALHFLLVQVWLGDLQHIHWWEELNSLLSKKEWSFAQHPNDAIIITIIALLAIGLLFSWRFNLNVFGLNQFYRNRLVRCYLGGTRWKPGMRTPDRFTAFDEGDDLELEKLQFGFNSQPYSHEPFRGPFPIVNCALNLGGSSDLTVKTRQSASFTLTPLTAGASRVKVGYAPMPARGEQGFAGGVKLGEAISISGAAASPNMGYNTSPLVSVLLTMFNVRLAWWFPNPGQKSWNSSSAALSIVYLLLEFLGLADEKSRYVNVSDGGHFENLAIYELIRRRVKVIIACDGECDPDLAFGSLGNVIRICETDFGAKIDIDVASIRKQNGKSRAHCAVGRITYSNGSLGYLIYLKSSITGDEDADVEQYRAVHPDFPHQSTGNQFFTEDQFESYRRLGHHIAKLTFRDAESGMNAESGAYLVDIASKLYDVWTPAGFSSDAFIKHAAQLDLIWERFRSSTDLLPLLQELMADRSGPAREAPPSHEELAACLELTQLMENVFLDLRLDDFWDHPDNRGWAMLFMMWAKSATFRSAWSQIRRSFGIRFEYFCHQHLGLDKDQPLVRV